MKREDIEIACKGLKDIIDYNAKHDTSCWLGWKVFDKRKKEAAEARVKPQKAER